jgi:hypothetical protein
MHKVLAGENLVIYTLKANGYHINTIDCRWGIILKPGPNIDTYFARGWKGPKQIFDWSRFAFVVRTTMEILGLLEPLNEPEESGDNDHEKEFLIEHLKKKYSSPQFYTIYMGASHSLGNGFLENPECYRQFEERIYPTLRKRADKNLIAMLEIIHRHDPEALVILIGDHAPHRYSGIERGAEDVNAIIRSCGIEPRLVGRDNTGVLCAIKWPIEYYSEGKVISHVNLFRHIFAALAEDPSLITKDKEPDESYVPVASSRWKYKRGILYRVAKDGVLLDNWETFAPPPLN